MEIAHLIYVNIGAKTAGADLSYKAIENAKKIAKETNSEAQSISCDIYDLENYLDEQFDIVYNNYGTITWLPYLDK